jgi:HAD superfamily hydrolase (TIGR01450 family)
MPAYDHLLLDLDGTLVIGPTPIAGASEAVAAAREAGLGIGFLTNDPVSSRSAQERRLRTAGIAARAQEVVTSARALALLVAHELGEVAVLALGSDAFARECEEAGLRPEREPGAVAAVLMGGSSEIGYDDLTRAVRAVLVHGAALYGSNRDATFPARGGPAPAAGPLVAALEHAVSRPARCAGKPEPAMFLEARSVLGDGRYLVVGDRLDSDVAGGAAAGMATALVLSGSTAQADLERWDGAQPDHVLASIADLPRLLAGEHELAARGR